MEPESNISTEVQLKLNNINNLEKNLSTKENENEGALLETCKSIAGEFNPLCKDEIQSNKTKNSMVKNLDNSVNGDQLFDKDSWTLESKLNCFLKWCKANGLEKSQKVEVNYKNSCHRYGLCATTDIKKGEVLFVIPRSMLLTPKNGTLSLRLSMFDEWLNDHGKSIDESSGWLPLLITLMFEVNNKNSFWLDYLRLIPDASEFGQPLFWKVEECNEEFKGMTFLNDVINDKENIESEYLEFVIPFLQKNQDVCGRLEDYSLEFFKRMVAFVMSYSFTDDDDSPCMVPMADLLNHHSNNNAQLVFDSKSLKMLSTQKIKKGNEIFNTFGMLGNSELLQMYGYVELPVNHFDCLLIPVRRFFEKIRENPSVSLPYLHAKIDLLNKTSVALSDSFFLFDKNGIRSGPDLMQFLKIIHATDNEFDAMLKSRASKRVDSFYHKLMRKLKVAKNTVVSSGVAVIDITEDENVMSEETENNDKRSCIELGDDNNGTSKRFRHDNGVSESEAIVIDDESEEEGAIIDELSGDGCDGLTHLPGKNETLEKSGRDSDLVDEVASKDNKYPNSSENQCKNTASVVDDPAGDCENTCSKTANRDKFDTKDQLNNDISLSELNDEDTSSHDEDIEFLSEDIRCLMSYETMASHIQPEWKETIQTVLESISTAMKTDELDANVDEFPRNKFNAYQIRRGQRFILNLFRTALDVT